MTTEEIIEMAKEAGFIYSSLSACTYQGNFAQMERLVTLVVAKEREECAALAADTFYGNAGELNHEIAAAIRGRSNK